MNQAIIEAQSLLNYQKKSLRLFYGIPKNSIVLLNC